jgi:hypothetical protein
MRNETKSLVRAFLHGMTGAGLFRKLDYPGAPKEFVDSRPVRDVPIAEFEETCRRFQMDVIQKQRDDVRRRARTAERPAEQASEEPKVPAFHRH